MLMPLLHILLSLYNGQKLPLAGIVWVLASIGSGRNMKEAWWGCNWFTARQPLQGLSIIIILIVNIVNINVNNIIIIIIIVIIINIFRITVVFIIIIIIVNPYKSFALTKSISILAKLLPLSI